MVVHLPIQGVVGNVGTSFVANFLENTNVI